MRPKLLSAALLMLPLLAGCGGDAPAPTNNAPAKPAATTQSTPKAPAPVGFPFGARPLLGTWAADASQCAGGAITEVTATSYSSGTTSCELKLTDNKDGTFTTTCGGQSLTLTPIFGPPGEGIRIAQGDSKPTNVFRCTR